MLWKPKRMNYDQMMTEANYQLGLHWLNQMFEEGCLTVSEHAKAIEKLKEVYKPKII